MHLFCVLIGAVALVGTAVYAQPEDDAPAEETVALETVQVPIHAPLSYDPYYVLPGGQGYTSVDIGVRTAPSTFKELKDVSNIIAMAKFNPHTRVEVGAHLTFGFFKDGNSNFSSLVVGSKYQLGTNRAATANIVLPAGDIDNPGLAIGLMQTVEFGTAFRLNSHIQVAGLEGYTGDEDEDAIENSNDDEGNGMIGNGVVGNLLIEPALVFNEKLSVYLDLLLTSNTSDLEGDLSIHLEPNLDLGIGDGMVLNAGVSVNLQGDEQEDMGLFIVLLRDM